MTTEGLKESMQRWIDYHCERADKAEQLIDKLVEAFGVYYNKYMLDEADSAENCVCGDEQHQDALRCGEALALADKWRKG